MKLVRSQKTMRSWVKGKRIGLVPTMGYLHEGHAALVRRAKRENDIVVVSIFVNPTQFGPKEDFKKYPRNLRRDLALLEKEKVDAVVVPSSKALYPEGVRNSVKAGPVSRPLEGPFRPGHFDGVCTVLKKLFEAVQPNKAYFGQKDFQQVRVVHDMVMRLKMPVRVVVCPTVREKDGLAMSSRNVYLSNTERKIAPVLYQTLLLAKKEIQKGEKPGTVVKTAKTLLSLCGFKVQYFSIASADTLKPIRNAEKYKGKIVVAAATYLGKTRLIDNIVFNY